MNKMIVGVIVFMLLALVGIRAQTNDSTKNQKEEDFRAITIAMPGDAYAIRHKVSLAPGRYFVLEYPANDSISTITPQKRTLLLLDEALGGKPNSKQPIEIKPGQPVIIRTGEDWSVDSEPTYLTVYMNSGAFLQLDILPIKDVFRSTDRISWRYNTELVARARATTLQAPTIVDNTRVSEVNPAPVSTAAKGASFDSETSALVKVNFKKSGAKTTPSEVKNNGADEQIKAKEIAETALVYAAHLKAPKNEKLYKNFEFQIFGKPSYWANGGLWTVSVVGVKNRTINSLQLTDVPYLQIETTGKKGANLNTQPVYPIALQTSARNNPIILAPGELVYFSFVYKTPVLGINQTLSLSVSNTNAADAPTTFVLKPGASF